MWEGWQLGSAMILQLVLVTLFYVEFKESFRDQR